MFIIIYNILQLIANALRMWNCKFCKLSFFIRIKEKYEIVTFVKSAFFPVKELKFKMKTKKKSYILNYSCLIFNFKKQTRMLFDVCCLIGGVLTSIKKHVLAENFKEYCEFKSNQVWFEKACNIIQTKSFMIYLEVLQQAWHVPIYF